jgi:NhaC family Na+:H+ antiporter
MYGMLNTVWLIICAMCFGGIMEASGFLKRISNALMSLATNTASLVATTTGTCIFFNMTASDQYLAIVVPGKMFKDAYKDMELAPENLSRTLEDSGTVTSVLIPWNTCGATQAGILGVGTLTYLPFCFFNIISPLMTILYAVVGYKIKKLKT